MNLIKPIDDFLNKITMYFLVLYGLMILVALAVIFGWLGILHINGWAILFSALFIPIVCWASNMLFAWAFDVPANYESVYITAFILVLIISPLTSFHDGSYFIFAIVGSIVAMASKYILAIGRKHIFNPAAIAVVVTAFALNQYASWWVGTLSLLPFVVILGFLIVRKIRRFDLVLSFLITAFVVIGGWAMLTAGTASGVAGGATGVMGLSGSLITNMLVIFEKLLVDTPIIFFACVMLTEPLTTPATRPTRIAYGIFVGLIFNPAIHLPAVLGGFSSTPELALVVGNIFSYLVSPKEKLMLELKEKVKVAEDTYNFVFTRVKPTSKKVGYRPGQYMEWTLPVNKPDTRGNRRYFTIASSPTEAEIIMGVKFYPKPSKFKQELTNMKPGDTILAGQRSGDFTLPHDKSKKLVFIAGGIGVTPFRSMLKFLIDADEKRDIIVLYSNRREIDMAYGDIMDEAKAKLGIKIVHVIFDAANAPAWASHTGYIDEKVIRHEVPDLAERTFYISGPQAMVAATAHLLAAKLGVHRSKIKKDFFPGFV